MDCVWTVLFTQSHYHIQSLRANFTPWLAHTSGSYPRPQQAQHSNYICLSDRDKQLACNDLPPCVATWLTAGSVDIYCCTACDPIRLQQLLLRPLQRLSVIVPLWPSSSPLAGTGLTHSLAQQPCLESSLGLLCGQHQSRLLPSRNGDVGFVQDATEIRWNMPYHHFHFISRLGVGVFALNRNERITLARQLIQCVWCPFYFKLLRLPLKKVFSSGLRDILISVPLLHSQRKQARRIFQFLIVLIEMLQSLPTADWWSTSLSEVVLIRDWK